MKETKVRCDKCGKIPEDIGRPKCVSITIIKGRAPDTSGNGYITDMDYLDICIGCIENIFNTLIGTGLLDTKLKFIVPMQPVDILGK